MVRNFSAGEKGTNLDEDFAGDNQASLQRFNLSQNKSLRTLETTAESITSARSTASNFLTTVLSTVASPVFLDVVIVYCDSDLDASPGCSYCRPDPVCFCRPRPELVVHAPRYLRQFRTFHEMHKTRDFRLVLCADVFDCIVERAIQRLKHIVDVNGGLDYLLHKPLIISERRTPRTRITDSSTGRFWYSPKTASAL
jgi:hypothetical protein